MRNPVTQRFHFGAADPHLRAGKLPPSRRYPGHFARNDNASNSALLHEARLTTGTKYEDRNVSKSVQPTLMHRGRTAFVSPGVSMQQSRQVMEIRANANVITFARPHGPNHHACVKTFLHAR